MTTEQTALALWAKSGDPYHPLLAHMLDTAAVAWAILEREPRRTRHLYAQDWGLPEEAKGLVAFLTGLHDLGKASPVFQAAWPEGAERLKAQGLTWDEEVIKESRVAHGVFTELYLKEVLKEYGFSPRAARQMAQGLGAHHGFQAQGEELKQGRRHVNCEPEGWNEVRRFLVERLHQVLGAPCQKLPQGHDPSPEAILRVMALASFADWIASDPSFFPYAGRPHPLSPDYWPEALDRAGKALDALPWPSPAPASPKDFQELFPFSPNPLQKKVPELLAGAQEPVLLLVEAPMGLGKTEAALYAYHLLQGRLEHRGLYVALPTQATANGLFPRVKGFLEKLGSKAPLDLQLQHGAAALNPAYGELLERAQPQQVYEEEGAVVASAWFSAKKRAMLSGHGVGTLDQALLGVLKVKHHFIRLWGLMNRVVVLDEVHAYDTYTSGLLMALLRWLRTLGSSVVLMTATLPKAKRQELLKAWGAEETELPPYPRVAAFSGGRHLGTHELPPGSPKVFHLEAAPVEPSSLAEALKARLPGALGAMVNTVDRAQALYQALGEGERLTLAALLDHLGRGPSSGPWQELHALREEKGEAIVGKRLEDGTLVFLLHARFPAEERALREGVALALFGKHGPRPERAILVATQVAEQSLDLDFDLLYTDLAPIDLLFQRAGRLQRHFRERPSHLREARLLVGGIEEEPEFGGELYWNRVYEDYILLSTWLSLRERKTLEVPKDLEGLLEEVYGRRPEGFPEPLQGRAQEAHKKLEERRQREAKTAENLALGEPESLLSRTDAASLAAEFRLDDEAEDERTQRFLTRLGDPSVAVVPLYKGENGYFLDPHGQHPARLKGKLAKEEVLALWRRAVRLSRPPIPQVLLGQEPPPAWRESGLLRGLRPLEVGRAFPLKEGGALRVELDPELGVVYRRG
ncbi:CRISPR-associated helicase/endonuclease Cas3 [Thermus igniterrae]|uniref:CRISPR-associated helicase/endonuclease Cas3 n=1 Tax=Thermus igniterrae TaxID=88189 RepID=UPI00037A6394|nr:CRISPR-associated helicase/endonuclease Cas3 [Thermus igniterrae]